MTISRFLTFCAPLLAMALLQACGAAPTRPVEPIAPRPARAWTPPEAVAPEPVKAPPVEVKPQPPVDEAQLLLTQAESDLQAGSLEHALTAYEALAKRPNPSPEALAGLRETKKRLVADLLLRAKDQRKSQNWPLAMRLSSRAKSLDTDDTALTNEAALVFTETHGLYVNLEQKSMAMALKQKLPAAALLYAQMILAVEPGDKPARKVRAKWASQVAAAAATRLGIFAQDGTGEPGQSKHGRRRAHAQPDDDAVTAMTMPGLREALVAGVRRGLAAAGLERAGIEVLTDKKAKTNAKLLLNVEDAKLERTATPEPRTKNYLDRVEIVDNPAWDEAQSRQADALLDLNVATQDLRPVQEALNDGEKELYNEQQQLAEIRKKIEDEDKAYYAVQPSPCPDGSIHCEGTRGNVRWHANVEYYTKQIQKQQAHLTELAPKRVQLQAVVDAKQTAYDAAQKVATDTPKRVPKEIWLPYAYQVEHQTYLAAATLTARLEQQAAPSKGRSKVKPPEPVEVRSQWQQGGQDFATGAITVKGQVLEPNHPSNLPTDPTVVTQVADKLLAPVMPVVIAAVGAHGQRFVDAAAAAKDRLAKIDQLALAWLTAPGLPQATRDQLRDQLTALTAWLPEPGRLDGGAILYDKLPALK